MLLKGEQLRPAVISVGFEFICVFLEVLGKKKIEKNKVTMMATLFMGYCVKVFMGVKLEVFKIVIKLYTTNRIRQIGTNDGWLEYHRYLLNGWL